MRKSIVVAAAFCLAGHCLAAPLRAQPAQEPSSRDLIRVLQQPIDLSNDFANQMTLKEVLGRFYEKVQFLGILGKGVGLPIIVDQKAFADARPDAPDIYESTVKFPPYPKQMTLGAALQFALTQAGNATFSVRRGCIEIIPATPDRLRILLNRRVVAEFEKMPLAEAIHELAEQTGLSILTDPRTKEKLATPVTAIFRNDTTVRDALILLADMADAKVIEFGSAVYVTSAANAAALKKSLPGEAVP